MDELDYDEIVYVDDEGLGYNRRDFPAFDFPVGTEVELRGVGLGVGEVIAPSGDSEQAPADGGALEHVLVLWDIEPAKPRWQHVDQLERV